MSTVRLYMEPGICHISISLRVGKKVMTRYTLSRASRLMIQINKSARCGCKKEQQEGSIHKSQNLASDDLCSSDFRPSPHTPKHKHVTLKYNRDTNILLLKMSSGPPSQLRTMFVCCSLLKIVDDPYLSKVWLLVTLYVWCMSIHLTCE